jgi:sterol 3beta-glucosyltransferase
MRLFAGIGCRCGVLVTGGWQPLADAYAALQTDSRHSQLFLQQQPLACHHLLLSAADSVLHHGGSGTTAAALAAGTPQLICPLQFDQYYWVSCLSS